MNHCTTKIVVWQTANFKIFWQLKPNKTRINEALMLECHLNRYGIIVHLLKRDKKTIPLPLPFRYTYTEINNSNEDAHLQPKNKYISGLKKRDKQPGYIP
jgi:hypothetical protein